MRHRYLCLIDQIRVQHPQSILEIGTYDGKNAIMMIIEAYRYHQPINYYGFDLFENPPAEEFGKTVPPPDINSVLNAIYLNTPGRTEVQLFKGFSRDTVPKFANFHHQYIDLIYIDGGHSKQTILDDWNNVQPLIGPESVVIFDDFYLNKGPDFEYGCNTLIDSLDNNWAVVRFGRVDSYPKNDLEIGMVMVKRRNNETLA